MVDAEDTATTNGHLQVIWAVKHSHIGDAFFDLDAAAFLCTQIPNSGHPGSADKPTAKKPKGMNRKQPRTAPVPCQTLSAASAELVVHLPNAVIVLYKTALGSRRMSLHGIVLTQKF